MDITKIYNDYMAGDMHTMQMVGDGMAFLLVLVGLYLVYRFFKLLFGKRAPRLYDVNPASIKQTLVNEEIFAAALSEWSRYRKSPIRNERDLLIVAQSANVASDRTVEDVRTWRRRLYEAVFPSDLRDYEVPYLTKRLELGRQAALDKLSDEKMSAQDLRNLYHRERDTMEERLNLALLTIDQLEKTNKLRVDASLLTQRSASESEIQVGQLAGSRGVSERNYTSKLEGRLAEIERQESRADTATVARSSSGGNNNRQPPAPNPPAPVNPAAPVTATA